MIRRILICGAISVAFCSFCFGLPMSSWAVTYYVDFDSGADTNNGTSTATPWKHSPGDPNATNTSGTKTLVAGDTINFKSGVRYQGTIQANWSGNISSQITYQGRPAGWGNGKAIIDGTIATAWTQCPDAPTCGGNPNYANIFYATLPAGAGLDIPVLDSDVPLAMQTDVTLADRFNNLIVEEWHALSSGITATTATDISVFTDPSSDYYVGAYIYYHRWSGNSLARSKISSYNPATNTITYANLGFTPTGDGSWDNKFHYAVMNNYRALNAAGTYAVDEGNLRIYAWPRTAAANLRIGSLSYGFSTNGQSYLTIDGFKVIGQYARTFLPGIGVNGSTGNSTNGLIIQNNDFISQTGSETAPASGNIYIRSAGTTPTYVRDNTMSHVTNGRGLTTSGSGVYTQRNTFAYIKGTVIFYFVTAGNPSVDGEIDGNVIQNCAGIHANGLALYGTATDTLERITVKNNRTVKFGTRAGPFAATMQYHRNLTFYNNEFGQTQEQGRAGSCAYMRFYNNTIFDPFSGNHSGLVLTENAANCTEFTVQGNILDGFGTSKGYPATHKYNVYVGYYWSQGTSTYGWVIDPTETLSNPTAVFRNYLYGDFALRRGSPAIGKIPAGQAPTGTFTTDIGGLPRTLPWDAGAYMFGYYPMYPTNLQVK